MTGGRGLDVAVDPVGGAARRAAAAALALFGRLVVVGNASGHDVSFSSDELWHQTRTLCGFSLGAVAPLVPGRITAAAGEALGRLAADGRSAPVEVVTLEQAREVHVALEQGRAASKTMLRLPA